MKKITRLFGLGFLSVAALTSFTSCGRTGFKVGLLCLHGQTSTYDNNFIQAFEEACKLEGLNREQYDIRTDVAEDYNKIYTATKEWAEDGYAMVAADSFGHQYGMIDVVNDYPETVFCHATGDLAINAGAENFHNAFAAIYKGRYLAGVVAGMKMVEDIDKGKYKPHEAIIGYVGAFDYAEVISGYTSFFLGARSIFSEADDAASRTGEDRWDSKLQMKVRYTYSWYDFEKESTAADTLIRSDGCKLISQHADSMGAPLKCKDLHIPNVGYNISTKYACPETYLVASKINWTPYYRKAIQHAKAKYKGEPTDFRPDYCGELTNDENNAVELCELGENCAKGTKEKLEEVYEKLTTSDPNNKIYVFDTSKFTITESNNARYDKEGKLIRDYKIEDSKSTGRLTSFKPHVKGNDDDRDVILTTSSSKQYLAESDCPDTGVFFRSAPYFTFLIDGIEIKNN